MYLEICIENEVYSILHTMKSIIMAKKSRKIHAQLDTSVCNEYNITVNEIYGISHFYVYDSLLQII